MIKVMIVDDSKVQKDLLQYIIGCEDGIEVVATASNGYEALDILEYKQPDIILMDINMPGINGFDTSKEILNRYPIPIIMISATWDIEDALKIIKNMELGVLIAVKKPSGIGSDYFKKDAQELIENIKLLSEIKIVRRYENNNNNSILTKNHNKVDLDITNNRDVKVVAIGSSAGGPPALKDMLSKLSANFPIPIVVVQHMTSGFDETFTHWLDLDCPLKVVIAQNNIVLQKGYVYIAPDSFDIKIDGSNRIKLEDNKSKSNLLTSISTFFESVKDVYGKNSVAILLSGMGRDGVKETKALRQAGAITIAQDEKSSIVYGIPYEAALIDAIEYILPPDQIAQFLNKNFIK